MSYGILSRQELLLSGRQCELVHYGWGGEKLGSGWYGVVRGAEYENGFDMTLTRATEFEALEDLDKLILGKHPYGEN